MSWLSFNERVLQEAEDSKTPLVERMRFLGIFSNNLDEFFRVRVANLRRMVLAGTTKEDFIGGSPQELLQNIHKKVIILQKRFELAYSNIIHELKDKHIFIVDETKFSEKQADFVRNYFQQKVRPSLSIIMVSNIEEFPQLRDKSIYLAVRLSKQKDQEDLEYALIEVPTGILPRFVILPADGEKRFMTLLDDVIRYNLNDVFSSFNYDRVESFTIKLTRDAELDLDDDISKSLLEKVKKSLKKRREGVPVRFVYDSRIPDDLLNFLMKKGGMSKSDALIPGGKYHNFKDFIKFPNLGGAELEYREQKPIHHRFFKPTVSKLDVIKEKDVLLHYPYQNFGDFIEVLRESAIDPGVKSIKITLYRVAKEKSRIINALINAAQNGKSVTVVIELQARFDEESNIYWSNKMQEAGVKIIFGVSGLKVHCKLCLITRKKDGEELSYASVGTGNYNESTAKVYSDIALLTADKRITKEVEKVFDFLEHNYKKHNFKHLILSPYQQRTKLVYLINREITNKQAGKDAYIIIKINDMMDKGIIKKLYEAGRQGVKIKLIVRGSCALIPGIEGVSENIEAISIIDRYLEHSRIFIFCNGGEDEYYISSANIMKRNIEYRVEVTCPIYDKTLQKQLQTFIDIQLRDNTKARVINQEQNNEYRKTGSEEVKAQEEFYKYIQTL